MTNTAWPSSQSHNSGVTLGKSATTFYSPTRPLKVEGSEELRRKKVLELFNDIHESMLKSEVVDIGRLVFKTTLNLLSNTIYSEDLVHSADKAGEFKDMVANIMKEIGRPNLADC
ncbi:Cytochrome P450 76C4 [Sesbania bispinosa]|nr:Cytochrome P450 76C4 [Sesbania bispinosa]